MASQDTRISRRTILIAGGASAGALALAGGAFWLGTSVSKTLTSGNPTQSSLPGFGIEPEILRSSGGKLTVDLVAAYSEIQIGGKPAKLKTYNGTTPGPTWMVKPGDVITVNFTNNLGEPTNLHTHGFHVSPAGNSDNVFVEVADGETFTYQYTLADNHPSAPFWYHPHHHGMAADQVFAGLYGAIVVEDTEPIPATKERVLVLSDISLQTDGNVAGANMMSKMMGREGDILLLNGQVQPSYASDQNALERWRIVNSCTSRYMKLSVPGGTATLLGKDSGRYAQPQKVTEFTLAPGNRADLLVQLGSEPVSLSYTTVPHPDAMMMGSTQTYTNYPLAQFIPGSTTAATVGALPTQTAGPDLRSEAIADARSFTLKMPNMGGMGGMGNMNGGFTINGQAFNMDVINTSVKLGTVEEWTIINGTTMDHPFHLHVWPMQVLSIGDSVVTAVEYQDVVNVPANSRSVIRVHFDEFEGNAVYHCHILDHEDQGMMGIIEANPA